MNVDDIDTYSPGAVVNFQCSDYSPDAVVNFQRSDGSIVSAKILSPSKRCADHRFITYERSSTVVTHDCVLVARMSFLRVLTPPRTTSAPTMWIRDAWELISEDDSKAATRAAYFPTGLAFSKLLDSACPQSCQIQVSPETPVRRHCPSSPQCAGPRAPARQMVVRLILCPCREGSEAQGTSQTSCQTLQTCSQTCAQVAAKPAAKPAAGEPIPVAPVEHVQLFKVKYSRQRKWHTEPVAW